MPILSYIQTAHCSRAVPSLKVESLAAHCPVFVQVLGANKYWHRHVSTPAASAKFNDTRLSPAINFHNKPDRTPQANRAEKFSELHSDYRSLLPAPTAIR